MENIEQTERDLLEMSHQVATLGEYFGWLQQCEEFITQLEERSRVKRPRLSIGNRQSVVARIARLEGVKIRLQRQFIPSGGEYSGGGNNAQRLVWREIDTAFENRILTGAVINADYIEPLQFLENAKDIVIENVQKVLQKHTSVKVNTVFNADNACFAWAVVAALYPAERHMERESSYPHYTKVLNLQDIEFPVTVNQIKRFEHANDISINVYTLILRGEGNVGIAPIRLSELKKDKHVNLLYVEDPHNNSVGHFTWIKNLSRLVSSQLSKKEHMKYICDRCLHYFHSDDKLQSHMVDCREMNDCAILLPRDDKWLTFENYYNKERLPFVVYADLECILAKTDKEKNLYQHHK
ncbi:hypothetical protein RF55_21035, partial [Lasius niger]